MLSVEIQKLQIGRLIELNKSPGNSTRRILQVDLYKSPVSATCRSPAVDSVDAV